MGSVSDNPRGDGRLMNMRSPPMNSGRWLNQQPPGKHWRLINIGRPPGMVLGREEKRLRGYGVETLGAPAGGNDTTNTYTLRGYISKLSSCNGYEEAPTLLYRRHRSWNCHWNQLDSLLSCVSRYMKSPCDLFILVMYEKSQRLGNISRVLTREGISVFFRFCSVFF